MISSVDLDADALVRKAKASPGLIGRDLVKEVTSAERLRLGLRRLEARERLRSASEATRDAPPIVALDYGIKLNILRRLVATGFRVKVMPAASTAEQILAHNPDGVFLSNGPARSGGAAVRLQSHRGRFGQEAGVRHLPRASVLGLALGGKTYKLDFGHHGANHPVMDLRTRRVEITSQNHGFAVDDESLKGRAELSHLNLNDKTVEGMQGTGVPFFSVQYHPEASPGPHDSSYLFATIPETGRNVSAIRR